MPIIAYVKCAGKAVSTEAGNLGWSRVSFAVDKADPRNSDWAYADDVWLAMSLVCTDTAAAQFDTGSPYTLTIATIAED